MKKKAKKMAVVTLLAGTATLSACTPPTIQYNGKQQQVQDVEEIIADQLEVENPNLDIEVSITEQTDD